MDASFLTLGFGAISWAAKLLVDLLRWWRPETAEKPGRTVLVVVLLSILLAALWPIANGQVVTAQLLAQAVFLGLGAAAGAIGSTEAHKRSQQAIQAHEELAAGDPAAEYAHLKRRLAELEAQADTGGERAL